MITNLNKNKAVLVATYKYILYNSVFLIVKMLNILVNNNMQKLNCLDVKI